MVYLGSNPKISSSELVPQKGKNGFRFKASHRVKVVLHYERSQLAKHEESKPIFTFELSGKKFQLPGIHISEIETFAQTVKIDRHMCLQGRQ